MDNGFEMQFFGGHHGETLGEVEPHLIPKNAQGSCSSTVAFLVPVLQYVFKKIVVLFHAVCSVTNVISSGFPLAENCIEKSVFGTKSIFRISLKLTSFYIF